MRRYLLLLTLLALCFAIACTPRSRSRGGGDDDDDSAGGDDDDATEPVNIPDGHYTGDATGKFNVFGEPGSCEGSSQLTLEDGFAAGQIACLDSDSGVACIVSVIDYDVAAAEPMGVAWDCYPLTPGEVTISYVGDGVLAVESELDDVDNGFFGLITSAPTVD